LYAFLLTEFGQNYLKREARGSVQQHVFLSQIHQFEIPVFSESFQTKIQHVIEKSDNAEESADEQHTKAETLLLDALNMKGFSPTKRNINIKSFKDSFTATGRLDAEYYQPKYEEIEHAIISFSGDCRLGNLIEYINTGEYSEQYLPKGKGLKFYIRSTNIQNGLIEEDENYFVNPDGFTKFVQQGDIVTARVGTLGVFGAVNNQTSGSIFSDNVLCFRLPGDFNPNVYTLWFNSKFNWELIDRLARGSVQQRLNQETLRDLLVPIIPTAAQNQIAAMVQESFVLKAESERLLEVAKRAVEIAIEQDENAGMAYIEENS